MYRGIKACIKGMKNLAKSMEMAPKGSAGVKETGFYIPEFPKEGKIAK
jgi:hypothetical protein